MLDGFPLQGNKQISSADISHSHGPINFLELAMHNKRIHTLGDHAECYCSLWGGESVPAQANCTVQCTKHADPPLDATMVLCINKWWACTKSQCGVRTLSHTHKVWTCSLEATLFTGNWNWVWSHRFRTVMPNLGSLDLHCIVEVVSLVYFKRSLMAQTGLWAYLIRGIWTPLDLF